MEELKAAMDEVAAKSSPDLQLIDRIGMVSVPCFQKSLMKFGQKFTTSPKLTTCGKFESEKASIMNQGTFHEVI